MADKRFKKARRWSGMGADEHGQCSSYETRALLTIAACNNLIVQTHCLLPNLAKVHSRSSAAPKDRGIFANPWDCEISVGGTGGRRNSGQVTIEERQIMGERRKALRVEDDEKMVVVGDAK